MQMVGTVWDQVCCDLQRFFASRNANSNDLGLWTLLRKMCKGTGGTLNSDCNCEQWYQNTSNWLFFMRNQMQPAQCVMKQHSDRLLYSMQLITSPTWKFAVEVAHAWPFLQLWVPWTIQRYGQSWYLCHVLPNQSTAGSPRICQRPWGSKDAIENRRNLMGGVGKPANPACAKATNKISTGFSGDEIKDWVKSGGMYPTWPARWVVEATSNHSDVTWTIKKAVCKCTYC